MGGPLQLEFLTDFFSRRATLAITISANLLAADFKLRSGHPTAVTPIAVGDVDKWQYECFWASVAQWSITTSV